MKYIAHQKYLENNTHSCCNNMMEYTKNLGYLGLTPQLETSIFWGSSKLSPTLLLWSLSSSPWWSLIRSLPAPCAIKPFQKSQGGIFTSSSIIIPLSAALVAGFCRICRTPTYLICCRVKRISFWITDRSRRRRRCWSTRQLIQSFQGARPTAHRPGCRSWSIVAIGSRIIWLYKLRLQYPITRL